MKRYVFGPLLLDPRQQVLFHGAERVPLAPKTFDLLLLLVENAGQVVSREVLRDRVWADSFVEEALISKNVSLLKSRLRPFLGDNGFIETIPKRGYRLNVDVEVREEDEPGSEAAPEPEPMVASETDVRSDPEQTEPEQAAPEQATVVVPAPRLVDAEPPQVPGEGPFPPAAETRPRRVGVAALFGAALLLLCAAAVVFFLVHARHRESERLAVMPFRNLADAPEGNWIGVALQESLRTQLSAEGGLPLVSGEEVAAAERDLGVSNAHNFTESETEALGRRLGSALILAGTYIPIGDHVRVDFGLWNTRTGKLTEQFSDTVPQADLADVVKKASGKIRSRLKLPVPSSSPDIHYFSKDAVAPQEYAEGLRLARSGNAPQQAREAFSKAVEADPNFAEAHLALANTLAGLSYTTDARQEAQRALDTSAGIPDERRRLTLQGEAYRQHHDYAKAAEIFTTLRQRFPRDPSYTTLLAQTLISLDKLPEALQLLTEAQQADKTHPDPMITLMRGELMQMQGDRKAELFYAGEALKQARSTGSRSAEGYAYLDAGTGWHKMQDDAQAMANYKLAEQVFSQIGDSKGVLDTQFDQAELLKDTNDPEASEAAFQQALAKAEELNDTGMIGSVCINLGFLELDLGHPAKAVPYFQYSIQQAVTTRSARLRALSGAYLVYAYLQQGDVAHAQTTLEEQSPAKQPGATATTTAFTALSQARIDAYLGKLDRADADYKQALTLMRQIKDANHINEALQEYSLLLVRKGEVPGAQAAFNGMEKSAIESDPYSQIVQARIFFEAGDLARAESTATAALKSKGTVDGTASGYALMSDIAVRRTDWTTARAWAHKAEALAAASPDDTMLQLASARQAAFVDMKAGDTSSAAVRSLPGRLRQAQALKASAEVTNIRLLLAKS